jgi:hypothetical protein
VGQVLDHLQVEHLGDVRLGGLDQRSFFHDRDLLGLGLHLHDDVDLAGGADADLDPFEDHGLQLGRRGAHLELARLQLRQPERTLVARISDLGSTDLRVRGGGDLDALERHPAFVEHVTDYRPVLPALRVDHRRRESNEDSQHNGP